MPQIFFGACRRSHLKILNQTPTVPFSASEMRTCPLANALLNVLLNVFRILNPLTLNFMNE